MEWMDTGSAAESDFVAVMENHSPDWDLIEVIEWLKEENRSKNCQSTNSGQNQRQQEKNELDLNAMAEKLMNFSNSKNSNNYF